VEAHKIHSNLIQKEATGEKIGFSLLFMHAEDQMASTEIIQLLSKDFMDFYQNKWEHCYSHLSLLITTTL
ncbi:PTS lactose/cellobiose transporter subunit IIA, partial [Burkholderia contaminans]|nr:PTS lactose/cellobiose transporter subunit IIA [Burkholderia contaminans]